MDGYYLLVSIKLIGIFLFLVSQSAIATIDLGITLNTLQNTKITNISTCDVASSKYLSSVNNLNNGLKAEKNTNTINQTKTNADLPQASVWWAAEQFDPFDGNLIQDWLTYPQRQQINLMVDWQLWTTLDYFGRYRFVNQFGTVVRKHGYSLNVVSQKEQCLATYKYNSASKPPKWELHLEKLGRDSLEVENLDS